MVSKEIISYLRFNEENISTTTNDLIQSKDFYLLVESFCASVSRVNIRYAQFLNYYFNDEGYIDCWQIPHLMLDIYNNQFDFHEKKLNDSVFVTIFIPFILEFYNFCMNIYKPYLLKDAVMKNTEVAILQLQLCKHKTFLFMDIFSKVLENINQFSPKKNVGY